jgi:hypothetical protein
MGVTDGGVAGRSRFGTAIGESWGERASSGALDFQRFAYYLRDNRILIDVICFEACGQQKSDWV